MLEQLQFTFHYFDFSANCLLSPAVNCWVALSCKYGAVRESVEIVISGDHEREVIDICGYTLIAVIICRPPFFAERSPAIIWQNKIAGSERKSYCVGLRVKTGLPGSNPEAGCRDSANQEMSISSSRRKKHSPSKKRDGDEPRWRRQRCFMCSLCMNRLWMYLTLMCESVLTICP